MRRTLRVKTLHRLSKHRCQHQGPISRRVHRQRNWKPHPQRHRRKHWILSRYTSAVFERFVGVGVSIVLPPHHIPPDPHYPDTPTTAPQPLRTRPLFSSALLLVPRAAMRLEPFVLLRSQQIPHRRLRCFASLPPGGRGVPRSPPVKGQLRRKCAKALHWGILLFTINLL